MVMTFKEMERYVSSEVDNLRLRVDILTGDISKLEVRFDRLEHRFDLMQLLLDELTDQVAEIRRSFATKDDLKNFATKDDLKRFATKDDLRNFATKKDLAVLATKKDLENFVTKDYLESRLDIFFNRLIQALRPV